MANQLEIEDLAYDMVKNTYPIKEEFESHINGAFTSPEYYELLIHLSEIIFAVGTGVLANIAFKNVVPSDHVTKKDIQSLVSNYERKIEELREKLEEQELLELNPLTNEFKLEFKDCSSIDENEISLCLYHEKMLLELKEKDPEIVFAVNEALEQLNSRSN